MNHKARTTIETFAMLSQGDRVTAAVSGGADSVALLDFLCSLLDYRLTVSACHLNHCLRGAESDRDEQLVRTMCAQYGIPLTVRRVDVAAKARSKGLSLETAARQARYAFFDELAAENGCKIATAHTLSDTAETVLFNLARGTGIAGLCGIPPVRGHIIRPLIGCTREQVEAYCHAHGLCYVTDSTNLSDLYTRNHIRHNIIPQLARVNSAALEAIGRMTDALREDAEYLSNQARQAAQQLARDGGLDAAETALLHPALRARVLALLLEESGVECSALRMEQIESLLKDGRKSVLQVGSGKYIVVREGILRFERRVKMPKTGFPAQVLQKNLLDGQTITLDCKKQVYFSYINCLDYEISDNIPAFLLKNAVDYDKIDASIILRTRQAGDRIRQAGRGCSKTLKKLFNELGLKERDRLCVIADSQGVVFAQGAGPDERAAVDKNTRRALAFYFKDEQTGENNI